MRIHSALLAAFVLGGPLAWVGCGGEGRTEAASWAGTIDTVSGVVVVNNPATPILQGDDGWRLEETLSIGVLEGDPDYQFSSVRQLEVDDAGDIYVLDSQARRVAIYDSTGRFVAAFGRQGEGPGEFENPGRMTWKADTLVVWDWRLRRFSYFDRRDTLLRDERLDIELGVGEFVFRPDGLAWAQRGPSYWMPARPDIDGIGWLMQVDLSSGAADTLLKWNADDTYSVRSENFMMVRGKPYAASVEWTAGADGHLYVARGVADEIEVYSPDGDRVRTIRRDYTRHPPSAAERDSALAELEESLERFEPSVADRVRKAFEIANPKQVTDALTISDAGYLWVRISTADDIASQTWDVFEPDGRFIAQLVTPARLTIHRIVGDRVYASVLDDFDVPYVKRYSGLGADVPVYRERAAL